jgi:hypothetical protein
MFDSGRNFPDLLDPLSWNLIYRGQLVGADLGGGKYQPIPQRTHLIESSRLVAVGCKNPESLSYWYHGAWLHAIMPQQLDSQQILPAIIYTQKGQARLRGYTLFSVPPWMPLPWILQIDIARWHRIFDLEIYWYDGGDYSLFNQPP